jgi:hypothetical protein
MFRQISCVMGNRRRDCGITGPGEVTTRREARVGFESCSVAGDQWWGVYHRCVDDYTRDRVRSTCSRRRNTGWVIKAAEAMTRKISRPVGVTIIKASDD